MACIFRYVWLSLEMMCIAFIILFLENIKLFYALRGLLLLLLLLLLLIFFSFVFNVHIEILADSNLCNCLKAIKCSESEWRHSRFFFISFILHCRWFQPDSGKGWELENSQSVNAQQIITYSAVKHIGQCLNMDVGILIKMSCFSMPGKRKSCEHYTRLFLLFFKL